MRQAKKSYLYALAVLQPFQRRKVHVSKSNATGMYKIRHEIKKANPRTGVCACETKGKNNG